MPLHMLSTPPSAQMHSQQHTNLYDHRTPVKQLQTSRTTITQTDLQVTSCIAILPVILLGFHPTPASPKVIQSQHHQKHSFIIRSPSQKLTIQRQEEVKQERAPRQHASCNSWYVAQLQTTNDWL